MSVKVDPIFAWILHAEDDELKHIQEVSRTDTFDGASNEFHDDGLFSTRIFGRVGSPERDERYGKINLKVRIFHPAFYERLGMVKRLYRDILDGTATAVFDKNEKDFVRDAGPDAETGYSFFMRHFKKIEFRKNTSNRRSENIDFIVDRMERATMKNLIVIPAGIRDVEMDENGRPRKDEINDFYTRVLSIAGSIIMSSDLETDAYDQVRRSLTHAIYDLYKHIEGFIGGEKFINQKVVSRRVHDSTRNVLTSMNTGGLYLGAPNSPTFDATTVGVHQAASTFAPHVIGWLRRGVLDKIVQADEGVVPLINKKTLKIDYVQLQPMTRMRFTSEDGIRSLIDRLRNVQDRHKPVELDGYYLTLIYQDDKYFKVFDDINELPSSFDKNKVRPISLVELIYLSGYNKWGKLFATVTRYPVNNEDSIYPTRLYCKTTAKGLMLRELGYDWEPIENNETTSYTAVEFPDRTVSVFHDSQGISPSRLMGLSADFDGDTGNFVGIHSEEANREIDDYLGTREAWVKQDGELRVDIAYDTVDLIVRNLTGRFDHVRNVKSDQIKSGG